MYQTLIPKIKTVLSSVTEIQYVVAYPTSKIDGYPAAMVMPIRFNNQYLTSAENLKGYTFRIYIIQELQEATRQTVFEDILPKCVDAILTAFDQDWGFDSIVSTHRIWQKIETGDWYVDEIAEGEVAVAEMDLTINMGTTIT